MIIIRYPMFSYYMVLFSREKVDSSALKILGCCHTEAATGGVL